ncbi:MAG: hypothetical protein AB1705_11240 [Verrucomicrobiota bacterium]
MKLKLDEPIAAEKLAAITRQVRLATGKTHRQIAEELGVSQPSVVFAETRPARSMTKLRKRIIETYSNYEVIGPFYLVREKRR